MRSISSLPEHLAYNLMLNKRRKTNYLPKKNANRNGEIYIMKENMITY